LIRLRSFEADEEVVRLIERMGLGQKRRAQDVKKFKLGGPKDNWCLPSALGAQGQGPLLPPIVGIEAGRL
jgi:hypothetical protein